MMPGKLKEIMVVDDEIGIRALLSDALEEKGYNVTLAKDGEESLRQLKKKRFDLLITDINMPHLNGLELLRKMKKEGRQEKVILMSGNSVDESILGKDIQPVFFQLKKPFGMNLFMEAVLSALETKNSKSKRKRNAA
ncbi:response regulator [Thermodesulfobacteriota bacterium]